MSIFVVDRGEQPSEKRRFKPYFKGKWPTEPEARWNLIRRFLSHWSRPADNPLSETCDISSKRMKKAAAMFDGQLSFSIRQWFVLIEQALAVDAPVIRDYPVLQPIEDFFQDPGVSNALTILESGESDIFWAVPNDRVQEPDPPVQIFQRYDESSSALLGTVKSVSEFALQYLCVYNEFAIGTTEWFSANAKSAAEGQSAVDWFDHVLSFPQDARLFSRFQILESQDIAAIVNGEQINVSVFCDPATLDLPPFLVKEMRIHQKLREEFRKAGGK